MGGFGQTLFARSPFIRLSLTPVLVVFAASLPFMTELNSPLRIGLVAAMDAACLALLAGFWLPARYSHWAFRFLSALVFCAYAAYLGYEFFISGEEFEFAGSEDASSPLSALLGFIVIGVPSGTYALLGRFTWRKEDEDHHFLGPG